MGLFNKTKIFFSMLVLVVGLTVPFAGFAQAANSPILLGGMDLNGYCASQSQGTATLNVSTWDCTGNSAPINMNAACVWQYNVADAFAQEIRTNDPYSYQCFSNTQGVTPTPVPTGAPVDLGGMTLDQYCASLGQGFSFLNNNVWSCTGNGQAINMNAACVWQYNVANAFAQEVNAGNVYSYNCFAPQGFMTGTPTPTTVPTATPTTGPTMTPSPTPVPTAAPTDDWSTLKYNAQRTGYNGAETIINATSAANLVQKLDLPCQTPTCNANSGTPGAVISDAPAVVNNVMYYGDWTGMFYARNVKDGSLIWSKNLGVMTPPAGNGCNPKSIGVAASASVRSISVNGVQTPIVFISGADGNMYALYASNGTVLWATKLANPAIGEFLWDSPAEANGSVYVGLASFGDCPLVQGREYKLSWRTGAIQAMAKLVPDGCIGAGEWGSPTYDATNNKVYISTGTQDNSCKVNGQPFVEPNALAVVELDGTTLNILGASRIPANEQGPDSDYGVSPTLSTATINGVKTQLVSAGNKNGHYYIFKRDALSQGAIYDLALSTTGGGTCPDCSAGTISSSVTDGTTLYQAMGGCSQTNFSNCYAPGFNSEVVAINPATGAIIWKTLVAKQIVSTPILLKDVLLVFTGNSIEIMSRANGNVIKTITPAGAGSILDGSGSVARGQLFFGDLNGNFYEYGF